MAQTYRQVAKSVAEKKAQHPERYCPARGCLWKTAEVAPDGKSYILNSDPCRKHPWLNNAPARKKGEMRLKVLVGCEFSGIVRDAFIARGHDAWSCDLLPTERPGPHLQCDVLTVLDQGWDLIIAHPECRYLNHAGVRWLYQGGRRWNKDGSENPRDPDRWLKMEQAAQFFLKCLNAPCAKVVAENSEMHPHALGIIGRKADQVLQPWEFGHGEVKATHLWLKNLPPLKPTNIVEGRKPRVHHEPPSPERWKNRSRTLPGLAEAMAAQWG